MNYDFEIKNFIEYVWTFYSCCYSTKEGLTHSVVCKGPGFWCLECISDYSSFSSPYLFLLLLSYNILDLLESTKHILIHNLSNKEIYLKSFQKTSIGILKSVGQRLHLLSSVVRRGATTLSHAFAASDGEMVVSSAPKTTSKVSPATVKLTQEALACIQSNC